MFFLKVALSYPFKKNSYMKSATPNEDRGRRTAPPPIFILKFKPFNENASVVGAQLTACQQLKNVDQLNLVHRRG